MGFALDELQLEMRLSQGWTILMTGADVLALVGRQAALLSHARRIVKKFKTQRKRTREDGADVRDIERVDAKL
jgi:hypothetical protein